MRPNQQTMLRADDDEELSALLISLARDVRRVIRQGPSTPDEPVALNARLTRLRRRFYRGTATPLDRWLERLQNQLDASCGSAAL